jgi:hypothetical protein
MTAIPGGVYHRSDRDGIPPGAELYMNNKKRTGDFPRAFTVFWGCGWAGRSAFGG